MLQLQTILQHFYKFLIWPTFYWFSFRSTISIIFLFINDYISHQQFVKFFIKTIYISSITHGLSLVDCWLGRVSLLWYNTTRSDGLLDWVRGVINNSITTNFYLIFAKTIIYVTDNKYGEFMWKLQIIYHNLPRKCNKSWYIYFF